jgi:hypothetical protein
MPNTDEEWPLETATLEYADHPILFGFTGGIVINGL